MSQNPSLVIGFGSLPGATVRLLRQRCAKGPLGFMTVDVSRKESKDPESRHSVVDCSGSFGVRRVTLPQGLSGDTTSARSAFLGEGARFVRIVRDTVIALRDRVDSPTKPVQVILIVATHEWISNAVWPYAGYLSRSVLDELGELCTLTAVLLLPSDPDGELLACNGLLQTDALMKGARYELDVPDYGQVHGSAPPVDACVLLQSPASRPRAGASPSQAESLLPTLEALLQEPVLEAIHRPDAKYSTIGVCTLHHSDEAVARALALRTSARIARHLVYASPPEERVTAEEAAFAEMVETLSQTLPEAARLQTGSVVEPLPGPNEAIDVWDAELRRFQAAHERLQDEEGRIATHLIVPARRRVEGFLMRLVDTLPGGIPLASRLLDALLDRIAAESKAVFELAKEHRSTVRKAEEVLAHTAQQIEELSADDRWRVKVFGRSRLRRLCAQYRFAATEWTQATVALAKESLAHRALQEYANALEHVRLRIGASRRALLMAASRCERAADSELRRLSEGDPSPFPRVTKSALTKLESAMCAHAGTRWEGEVSEFVLSEAGSLYREASPGQLQPLVGRLLAAVQRGLGRPISQALEAFRTSCQPEMNLWVRDAVSLAAPPVQLSREAAMFVPDRLLVLGEGVALSRLDQGALAMILPTQRIPLPTGTNEPLRFVRLRCGFELQDLRTYSSCQRLLRSVGDHPSA